MSESANEVLKIDVDAVLRDRVPRLYRYIPDAVIRWLERFICQERMNSLLRANADREGVDFARGVLHDLGISYETSGRLPQDSRVIIVSNHPLGGLDGLVLADFVASHYGRKDIGFVVNDLLNAVKPLQSIFLPVNKFGKQSRIDARALDEAFASDRPIIMFPAGLVSRRNDAGLVRDLRWQKMVVNKALEYKRQIIPLHFDGENSTFFYKFARIRTKLGMKFNIEMICLPGEIFKAEGARFNLTIGEPILPSALRGGKEAREQADELCRAVYRLVNQQWQ
ncbi:MAG: 1-acyl-sn-glycerol-3-phosphate acyltransferase [Lachnoclostridium sp.]|nr:1-acyl-sn-glycerol-3-phosphate acyltransferase [Lachnoclostridium sp.]